MFPLKHPKTHIVKKTIKIAILFILALACVNGAQAQRRKIMYLQTYDWAPYHFGFLIGTNFMDYNLFMKENYQNEIHDQYGDLDGVVDHITQVGFQNYQITSVTRDSTSKILTGLPRPGFSVGVIGDLRLGDYFNLRFAPTYSMSAINIGYTLLLQYDDHTELKTGDASVSKNPHVNCLEFPLHLKYRSKRYNNIGAYLIGGINPKLYFTFTKQPVEWIRTKSFDLALELGTGFDIYNQWFKMGIEIKYGYGLFNVLSDDQVYYFGHPLEGLKNKQLQFSLTFE